MRFLDERNRVIKTPEVIAELHQRVSTEPAITAVLADITPDIQVWGQSGLHFSARHIASGQPVLLKVHVPHDQLWWTRALAQAAPHLIPHVFASGERLGDTSLGWIVWERIHHGLHPGWHGREFAMLLQAGVEFQIAARPLAHAAQAAGILHELRIDDLAERLEQGVRRGAPGGAERVLDRVVEHWTWVEGICEMEICHGDLHMANALCRSAPPAGEALLIDYHPTRMPWACEPAKPEILTAEPTRLGCRGLVAHQAAIRTHLGLSAPTGADLQRLQDIVLGWSAIEMWAALGPSPDPTWRQRHIWHEEMTAFIAAAAVA